MANKEVRIYGAFYVAIIVVIIIGTSLAEFFVLCCVLACKLSSKVERHESTKLNCNFLIADCC